MADITKIKKNLDATNKWDASSYLTLQQYIYNEQNNNSSIENINLQENSTNKFLKQIYYTNKLSFFVNNFLLNRGSQFIVIPNMKLMPFIDYLNNIDYYEDAMKVNCDVIKAENQNSKNAANYAKIFKEIGNKYGIDPRILSSIAAQETTGKHENGLDRSSPAAGLMQIEKWWLEPGEINVKYGDKEYNMNINENNIYDVNSNIEIAALIYLNSCKKAFQSYNAGKINKEDILSFVLQGYNYGEVSLDNLVKEHGKDWANNRPKGYGDEKYFEKIYGHAINTMELPEYKNENQFVNEPLYVIGPNNEKLHFKIN